MQNLRLFLFATLGMLLLLAWTTWQRDYHVPEQPVAGRSEPAAPAPGSAPAQRPGDAGPAAVPGTGPGADTPTVVASDDGARIHVVTDLLNVVIDTRGGTITHADLREYTVSKDDPTPFSLLQPQNPVFVAENGLVLDQGDAPDHRDRWQAERTEYRLADGAEELIVPLTWTGPNGLEVTKRYIFRRNSYVVGLQHEVVNTGDDERRVYQYVQLRRTETSSGSMLFGTYSYTGGVIYTLEDRYQKVSFDDMRERDLSRTVEDGWVAMMQHYFLSAWVPPEAATVRVYSRNQSGQFVLGMSYPYLTVQPGEAGEFSARLYVGPKEQDRLDTVAEGLELTVDYGWLTIISKPLFIALSWIHSVVGNWGWSIVLLTLVIKAVFFKLSETSYRSMARMRKLQPRMQQLKERYGDDKQRMNQELMQMYKEEKVNPLGGCLPILVQIPVFIGLYWMLLESVELRQAPWILWIDDLSTPDPYFVLPILMGVTMLLQQRLNPAPMDPIQQKVLMVLPVVFTVFFLFFPAGLVLYWVTNNTLSIAQQWVITRRIEAGEDKGGKRRDKDKDKPIDPEANRQPKDSSPAKAKGKGQQTARRGKRG
jgi:YidC/Oxa1 family membrane protein insertase